MLKIFMNLEHTISRINDRKMVLSLLIFTKDKEKGLSVWLHICKSGNEFRGFYRSDNLFLGCG